jgi:hypothetical protein
MWVLWSVTQELSSHPESTQKQRMISIDVPDPYAMRGFLPHH